MKSKIMVLLVSMMLLVCGVTAFAAPSPSVDSDEEITSDVLITTDMSLDELEELVEELVAELQEAGILDEDGMLTATGVQTVIEFLESNDYSENGEILDSGLVVQVTEDGREVAGLVITLDGEVIGTVELGAVVITPMTDEDSLTVNEDGLIEKPVVEGLSDDVAQQMEQALTQLFGTEDTVTPEAAAKYLDEVLASISNLTVVEDSVLSVMSVIDVSCSDYVSETLAQYGAMGVYTYDLGIEESDYVVAIHNYSGDMWEYVPSVNNGDGTVTFALSSTSPVAFVVSDEEIVAQVVVEDVVTDTEEDVEAEDTVVDAEEQESEVAEDAEETGSPMVMCIVVFVVIIAIIFFFVIKKRKKDEK